MIALVPQSARDKTVNRLAFDENEVKSVDLREDGALLFTLVPKAPFVEYDPRNGPPIREK